MTGPKISSRDAHVVVDAGEDGRPDVPALLGALGTAVAADRDARALFLTERDVLLDPLLLPLGDQRPDLGGRVGRVADLEPTDHRRQRLDDLVVALARRQDAGLRDAGLTVVHQRRELQALDGGAEIGVVEDDRRRLPAELEAAALELLAADRTDLAAGGGGTGERDLVDERVAHEVLTDLAAGGHHAHDALGYTGLFEQRAHEQRVERSLGRRLDDDRAAGEQRGRQLRHRDELRDVPRHDRRDHADAFVAHEHLGCERAGAALLPRELGRDADERS